jgi:hypothetical protein
MGALTWWGCSCCTFHRETDLQQVESTLHHGHREAIDVSCCQGECAVLGRLTGTYRYRTITIPKKQELSFWSILVRLTMVYAQFKKGPKVSKSQTLHDASNVWIYNDLYIWAGWWFETCLIFPFSWELHHPIWRTHIFQRGWSHQPETSHITTSH